MPGGRGADAVVEAGDAGSDGPGQGHDLPQVGEGHGHHVGPGGRERGEHLLQVPGDLLGVEPGPEHVVDPGDYGGQIGAQGQGGAQLFGADLPGEPSPDGQIGVLKAGVDGCEVPGEPVGEAAQAHGVVPVSEALGLAVSQRDVAQVLTVRHGSSAFP